MKIELYEIKIRDVVNGYVDSQENGVVGYGGKLNIRPAFQREFVYKEKQRNAVIETVVKGFPLNVMYWVEDENGNPIAPEEAGEDGTGQGEDGDSEKDEETDPENKVDTEVWKSFPIDPVTGYAQDPNTGYLIDPNTGTVVSGGSLLGEEEEGEEDTPEETKEDTE